MRRPDPRFLALVVLLALAGCQPTGDAGDEITPDIVSTNPELATLPDIPVIEDVVYGSAGGVDLMLDVCLPTEQVTPPVPRAAIVVVHGGSWTRGDKADIGWRAVCQWFADEGYPAFSVNYRLAPEFPYPAATQDVRAAINWVLQPEQLERYSIDRERIALFGGSAGGNLVSQVGLRGAPVAAVAELSGPVDLTGVAATDDFIPVQLSYLGCASYAECPQADDASPRYAIDAGDPPFFVAHSTDERIPIEQSQLFVEDLRAAGVPTEFVIAEGTLHSIAMLDRQLKERIIAFYARVLGAPALG